MEYIEEINYQVYQSSANSMRLMNVSIANYYYCIHVNKATYFLDANGSFDRIKIKAIEISDRLVLLCENRLYSFSLSTGSITLALCLWSPEIDLLHVSDFVLVIAEREVYKIDIKNSVIHSIDFISDLITDYRIQENKLVVKAFDGLTTHIEI